MTAPVDRVYVALDALRSHHPADEMALQAIVERVLLDSSIRHTREVSLGRAGRIDFLTASAIGLECKIKGGSASRRRSTRWRTRSRRARWMSTASARSPRAS